MVRLCGGRTRTTAFKIVGAPNQSEGLDPVFQELFPQSLSQLVSTRGVGLPNNRPHSCLLHSQPIHLLRSGKDSMDIANVVAALKEQRTRIDHGILS